MTKVSVIIKTLNEESNVARAIESSLKAVAPFDGEVIVADSASTDRTVERAASYPVTVVQLGHPDERCCGIGPQLGYQQSTGTYLYVLDGDMELDAAFIAHAVDFLNREPSVAGVGGYVHEMRVENLEFEGRVRRQHRRLAKQTSDVDALSGGGLYRRAAIEQVGYLSDRNLHSYEEYDLGARLRAKGWRLVRLKDLAANHYSYSMKTSRLLWRRIRTGYILGAGEIFRAAIAGHYLKNVLLELPALRIAIAVWAYWAACAAILFLIPSAGWALAFLLLAVLLPPAAMAFRTRSLKLGFHSVLLWHVSALGFALGLIRQRKRPSDRIECRTFQRICSQLHPAVE
jgi:GT2 family glycosyltransferase